MTLLSQCKFTHAGYFTQMLSTKPVRTLLSFFEVILIKQKLMDSSSLHELLTKKKEIYALFSLKF